MHKAFPHEFLMNIRVSGDVCVAPLQVFDYDFGLQDDFMGSAYLYLESLEQQRYVSLTILRPTSGINLVSLSR